MIFLPDFGKNSGDVPTLREKNKKSRHLTKIIVFSIVYQMVFISSESIE